MTANNPVPVAQYLRMSTEHQQYSTENQARTNLHYAENSGFSVIRTYSDPARSGLRLKNRPGLRELLRDVTSGNTEYKAILVYDVSRWGRFQDTDEAAHYEFLCKAAGIPIHYCAETFVNDGSMASLLMKALKRAMAGEYSRELGTKVLAGQKRLAELGFKMGGPAGYGLQRMLVSPDRKPKQLLSDGERKSIATDRVIFVPGAADEIARIRDIFRLFIDKRMSVQGIAREMNRRKIPYRRGKHWTGYIVRRTLSDPKYIGCSVFNRTSMRLGTPTVRIPKAQWVVMPNAHEAVVDQVSFDKAQELLGNFTIHKTNERILADLKRLWT